MRVFILLFLLTSLALSLTISYPPPLLFCTGYTSATCCCLQFQSGLCWVPPPSLYTWCSFGSEYPPSLSTWQIHPMPSSHRWHAIPSVKLFFTHSDTLHIFVSFLTVLLTQWSYTAPVCRPISSLALSSLEITDWDFHHVSRAPSTGAGTAGTQKVSFQWMSIEQTSLCLVLC